MDLPAWLLPWVLWPLLMSPTEVLQRKISSYLYRCLGLPHSLYTAALYEKTIKLQLPFSSLEEEFRVSRMRQATGIMVCAVRKWKDQKGLEVAESQLRHRALVGTVATGEQGSVLFLSLTTRKLMARTNASSS